MRPAAWVLWAFLTMPLACGEQRPVPPVPPPPPAAGPSLPPGSDDIAHRSFPWPLPVDDAELILTEAEVFAFGGMPPKRQVHAFNVMLDQPDATTRFRAVAERGRAAGRLYALCAFRLLRVQEPATLSPDLARGEEAVVVYEHDQITSDRPQEILKLIEARRLCDQMRRDRDEMLEHFEKSG